MDSETVVVVALGGNAITREMEEGDIYQQFANTRRALRGLAHLVEQGVKVAITHGNGPQVGNEMTRVEATRHMLPPVPLGVLVADLQGGMGYMIEQTLQNKLHDRNVNRSVVTLLTQVIVDKDDPSILNPTKFVGPFYRPDEIEELKTQRGYIIREDPGRGFRRVVPSPLPIQIVEEQQIRDLVHSGVVVISAGGGGIPVYVDEHGHYEGVDAVIDKDRASAVLAHAIGADELYILTAVERVALNFRQPNQHDLDRITASEARHYLDDGQFPAGSMGPKVKASLDFLKNGGKRAVICAVEKMEEAVNGESGTEIVLD